MRWKNQNGGFTSAELLFALAVGALIISATVVAFGTIVRNQPRVASVVEVGLSTNQLYAYYGISATKKAVTSAPNYGTTALAEKLREQFNTDVLGATSVFCLARNDPNTFHPTSISYVPSTDRTLDTPSQFRLHIIQKAGVPVSLFIDTRNYSKTATNASIFILGYSKISNELKVNAIYDIDLVKTANPNGFYASVKRFTNTPQPMYYDVFYPAYDTKRWPTTSDGFTPLFVAFERATRRAIAEGTSIERFKQAAERPFYFIWWPDPAAQDLRAQPNSYPPTRALEAYNHMGGRTSFMFTVPMFPSL